MVLQLVAAMVDERVVTMDRVLAACLVGHLAGKPVGELVDTTEAGKVVTLVDRTVDAMVDE